MKGRKERLKITIILKKSNGLPQCKEFFFFMMRISFQIKCPTACYLIKIIQIKIHYKPVTSHSNISVYCC